VVAVTGERVEVVAIPAGQDGRGRLVWPASVTHAERVALVVSGLTPVTKGRVSFTVELEAA
jgi:hypothetical protein